NRPDLSMKPYSQKPHRIPKRCEPRHCTVTDIATDAPAAKNYSSCSHQDSQFIPLQATRKASCARYPEKAHLNARRAYATTPAQAAPAPTLSQIFPRKASPLRFAEAKTWPRQLVPKILPFSDRILKTIYFQLLIDIHTNQQPTTAPENP